MWCRNANVFCSIKVFWPLFTFFLSFGKVAFKQPLFRESKPIVGPSEECQTCTINTQIKKTLSLPCRVLSSVLQRSLNFKTLQPLTSVYAGLK